eukprot:TRINITY_DN18845_c0_g1_i1.p1 TRINITY_DN18845_c0_g1~~TRINITY_DN18845_c0_g1_i1.p1  ORF type:complete len:925 (+),score=147.46 TRINITY_DN18845_c0_g1_i1:48-2822(+)
MATTMVDTADRRLPSTATTEDMEIFDNVIKRIRLHCWQQRIRIEQFLHDFDRSRSGSVTKDQFRRALHMSGLTNIVSESEFEVLFKVYPSKDIKRINYSAFCEEVDEVFTKKRLEKNPTGSTSTNLVSSILQSPLTELTPEEQNVLDKLNESLAAETKVHGLVLKTCFIDFDKHRSGKIRAPQFERALPFKVGANNLKLIIKKYTDKATDGVNYLKWIQDVERFDPQASQKQDLQPAQPSQNSVPRAPTVDIENIIVDLRRQIRQSRIRISGSMRDYDHLRTGFITPGQFRASLGQLRLQRLSLTEQILGLLCERYSVRDSQGFEKIAYNKFIAEMESAFTSPNMEKDPTLVTELSPAEYQNNPTTATLSPQDESRVACILEGIKSLIKSRRILLKPAFQDFDRATMGVYQTRATSKKRFERVLALNNINLTEAEYELLERKYATERDPESVNYVLFCNHIEEETSKKPVSIEFTATALVPQKPFVRQGKTGILSLEEVMNDIRSQVATQRIRISEFLRDFDKLRSGLIVQEQFASGLSMAGIKLDSAELAILVEQFASEKRKRYVRWTNFCTAVDNPSAGPPIAETLQPGTIPPQTVKAKSPELERILEKLREVVRTRGILLPPFFKDFDVHNTGQITSTRLAQSLARHGLPLQQAEVQTLTEHYQDARTRDVCYRKLIRDIDETECAPTHQPGAGETQQQNAGSHRLPVSFGFSEPEQQFTVETLLEEIRSKVVKDSIRVRDFFSYADKLRKGVIPKSKFRTGIDGSGMRLSEAKLQMLENEFMCDQRGGVDYIRFSDEVTPNSQDRHLEKNPGVERVSYRPSSYHPLKSDKTPLSETENAVVDTLLERLKTLTRTRRILPKPTFLDFDKIRKGHVSANQFAAALDKLQLRLTPDECERIIRRYETSDGYVNYAQFCNTIDP